MKFQEKISSHAISFDVIEVLNGERGDVSSLKRPVLLSLMIVITST